MRLYVNIAVIGFLASLAVAEDAAVSLKPGAVIQFSFPELPPTLYAQARNEPGPAMLTAQLPDNYTPEGRWPLFVFVDGGTQFLVPFGLDSPDLEKCRFLLLRADNLCRLDGPLCTSLWSVAFSGFTAAESRCPPPFSSGRISRG
jgi:hypothetical protein